VRARARRRDRAPHGPVPPGRAAQALQGPGQVAQGYWRDSRRGDLTWTPTTPGPAATARRARLRATTSATRASRPATRPSDRRRSVEDLHEVRRDKGGR